MPSPTSDGTSGAAWAICSRRIQVGGVPVVFTGSRPQWLAIVYSLGLFGVSRCMLAVLGDIDTVGVISTYAGTLATGALIGRYIRRAKGERRARIWSGAIGLFGSGLAVITPEVALNSTTLSLSGRFIIPLATLAIMLVVNLIGEALAAWFPAERFAEPVPPPQDSNSAQRPGRRRRRRSRRRNQ
jgi:hypothetical protein